MEIIVDKLHPDVQQAYQQVTKSCKIPPQIYTSEDEDPGVVATLVIPPNRATPFKIKVVRDYEDISALNHAVLHELGHITRFQRTSPQ